MGLVLNRLCLNLNLAIRVMNGSTGSSTTEMGFDVIQRKRISSTTGNEKVGFSDVWIDVSKNLKNHQQSYEKS